MIIVSRFRKSVVPKINEKTPNIFEKVIPRGLRRRAYKGDPLMQREDRGFDPRQEQN
ncbi:hypothetical protein H8356DRAFT_1355766 [Neocallimastix lanati (nom. inval.)]|nr:hypothetical protein H8356DRAFT_1355766 [Neocallimastix sp. JGI-2020a]